jgi:hypothetical protein
MHKRRHARCPHADNESCGGTQTGQVNTWWQPALLVAVLVLLPRVAYAQEENRAGLVVVFGDGRVEQQCVAFAEDSISGYDLLQRSGLPLSIEAGAIGPTVCSIGKEGCSYPQESCFCRCQGSPCVYWSYWRLQGDGRWRYQSLGAGNTEVRTGDVEGWRWAEGTTNNAAEPPAMTFADVCGVTVQQTTAVTLTMPAENAAPAAVTALVVTAVVVTATLTSVPPAAAVESTTAASVDAATGADPAQAEIQPLWLLLAGVIVVPALVLVVWALVRKGR